MRSQPAAERREALVELYREASRLHALPALEGPHQRRVRSRQRRRRPDVRGRGARPARGPQGLPFVGRAGQLLDKLLEEIGLQREDVFIANVLKCRPPGNRDPQPDEIEACKPYLMQQIELIEPQRDLHARQLRHEAAHPLAARHHPVRGKPQVHELGGRTPDGLPDLPPGRGAAHPAGLEELRADFAGLPALLAERAAACRGREEPEWRCHAGPRSRERSSDCTCSAGARRDRPARRQTEAAGAELAARLRPATWCWSAASWAAARPRSSAAPAARWA